MKDWLKKYFVPHEENSHRPHFLKRKTVAYLGLFVLTLEVLLFLAPTIFNDGSVIFSNAKESFIAAVFPGALTELTNQSRTDNNIPALTESPVLDQVATLKAQDMASKGYFAHVSPIDGKTPWYWFDLVGYKYNYAGENLAINFTDSVDVENAWMNSPTHKANIEKGAYTEIGTGVATGTYQGHADTIFVVQDFAQPYVASIAETQPASQASQTTPAPVETTPVATAVASAPTATGSQVLGTETSPAAPVKTQTPIAAATKIALSSPRHVANIILIGLAALIIVALLLTVIIRAEIQHPDLLINGLIILVIVFGAYSVNNFLVTKYGLVTLPEASTSSSTSPF